MEEKRVYNIAFVWSAPILPVRGGVERVTDTLARTLGARGHNIFYLTLGEPSGYEGYTPPASVHFLPGRKLKDQQNVPVFRKFVAENHIDIIINQMGLWKHSTLFTAVPKDACGRPACISVPHSMPLVNYHFLGRELLSKEELKPSRIPRTLWRLLTFPLYKRKYKNKRRKELAAVINGSDAYCMLSASHRKTVEDMGLFSPTACHPCCIPNPCAFPPLEAVPPKKKQLLYIGRLEPVHKASHRLLPIWERLCTRHPDWELVIVGDGPLRAAMEAKAAKLPRVRFEGFQNPEPYLRNASILCLTSNLEGFPMVLIEAMSFGTLPFAFDSFPALAEIQQEAHSLLSATPFKLAEYADKLSRLMDEPETRLDLARHCLERARKYSPEAIADQWEALFRQLDCQLGTKPFPQSPPRLS